MRLLVRLSRVAATPWPRSQWAAALAGALAERGHDVRIEARGIEPGALPAALTPATSDAVRHQRFDVRLSFDPRRPDEVWMPLGESAVESLHPRGVRRPWRLLGEPEARPRPGALRRVRTALAFDDAGAERLRRRFPALASRVQVVGWAAAGPHEPSVRAQVRAALAASDESLLLVALAGRQGSDIEHTLLAALHDALEDLSRPVVLATLTPSSLASRLRAVRAGCAERARPLGPTRRIDALLAGADASVALGAAKDHHIGHFLADALRAGAPALVARTTPGAGALLPGSRRGDAPGVVIDRIDVECLRRGLLELLTEPRLTSCRRACAAQDAVQSMDDLAARVELACEGTRLENDAPHATGRRAAPQRAGARA